jgi:5'-nucleotidase
MHILITNDDGYDAPGLHAAFEAVRELGTVHVVAPKTERSACSHAITLRGPIKVERRHHPLYGVSYAVDGTPADCVRIALSALIEGPVDLVVSGVNHGANAGVDAFYSGTVSGAREATILGITGIALSQAVRAEHETDWGAARDVCAPLVRQLAQEALPGPGFWSVNLPAPIPPEPQRHVQRVPPAEHPMPMKFLRSDNDDGRTLEFGYGASYWLREVSGPSDYAVIRDGGIAVTAIPLFGRF